MITIQYSPSFVRSYKKLHEDLKKEIKEKIDLFKDEKNHENLRLHPLKGRLKGKYSFSVNYKIRIVCRFEKTRIASMIDVGDHDIYS